jgi:ADP-ribosylglycohydrolase
LEDPLNPDYEDEDEADEGKPKLVEANIRPWPRASLTHPHLFDRHTPEGGGLWTDKTQLTVAVMRSIAQEQGFDIESIVEAHVEALTDALQDGSISSWPHTVRQSIYALAVSNSISESEQREAQFFQDFSIDTPPSAHITYFTSGSDASLSDSFMPKLTPLALYHASRDLETYSAFRKNWELERLIAITHANPLCFVTGIVYATFIERLARLGRTDMMQLDDYIFRKVVLMELFTLAKNLESDYGETEGHTSKTLSWIISNTEQLEIPELETRCTHSSRHCITSLMWTLGLFLLEGISTLSLDFTVERGAVYDARLSLVTTIFGFVAGRCKIESPYVDRLSRLEELLETSRNFAAALSLPTLTSPADVKPAENLGYVEKDDELVWALPHRPNGPLAAEALWFGSTLQNLASFFRRFWRLTGIGYFLRFLTKPSPFKTSAILIAFNAAVAYGVTALVLHGKRITAPKPSDGEDELHERYHPVLMPSKGGESRAFKSSFGSL